MTDFIGTLIADIEEIADISNALQNVNASKLEATNLNEVKSRTQALRQEIVAASERAKAVAELRGAHGIGNSVLKDVRSALMAEVEGKPSVLANPVAQAAEVTRAAVALKKQSRESADEQYRAWFEKRVGDLYGAEVLATAIREVDVSKGSAMVTQVQNLKAWRLAPLTPGLPGDVEQALEKIKEFETAVAPDGEIRGFLEAITGPGATLDMLSKHIEAWLGSKGLLGSLRLRLGGGTDGE